MYRAFKAKQFRLLPLSESHLDVLHALWTTPGVRKYLWDDKIISREKTAQIISQSIENMRSNGYGLWLAESAGQKIVGFSGFWPFHEPPRIELIFGIDQEFWNMGYATELGEFMIEVVAREFAIDPILASLDAANKASLAVLGKLGFRQTYHDEDKDTIFLTR